MPLIKRFAILLTVLASVAAATLAPVFSAYKGHEDDRDMAAILAAFPAVKGTPADSCAVCHRSGAVKDASVAGGTRDENHCDYCHAVFVRGKADILETLNAFGAAYLKAGRDVGAVRALAGQDTDADGFTNEAEFAVGTNPGEAASNPSVPEAPARVYTVAALRALAPVVEQTVFHNTTKNKAGDAYNEYRGQTVWSLLQALGVLETATSVDLMSVDGYETTFTIDELRKTWPQAPPVMGLGKAELGACGWVSYNARSLDAARPLPGASVMLAFEENGRAFDKARLGPDGRITGHGPLRVVTPQFRISPPDLPQHAEASCSQKVAPEYRFHEEYDHAAGKGVSAVVAIRVKPLPKGTRDVDWQTPALRRLAAEEVVVFGAIRGAGAK